MIQIRHKLRLAAAVLLAFGVSACARSLPNWPVTETSKPMSALNEALVGTAPPVARTVTSDRIRRARS